MSCHFTEEVSLLVDGELPPHEAARLRVHIEGCAACRQAREAFLLFRQELRAYDRAPDPHAQGRALASILNSRTSGGEEAAPASDVWAVPPATARGKVPAWLGYLAEAFSVSHLRPAHVATLALLLIGTVLGVRWFMNSDTTPRTTQSGAPVVLRSARLRWRWTPPGSSSRTPRATSNGAPSATEDSVAG